MFNFKKCHNINCKYNCKLCLQFLFSFPFDEWHLKFKLSDRKGNNNKKKELNLEKQHLGLQECSMDGEEM